MVVAYEKNENGKIEFTEKELTELLKQAENEGYSRGYVDGNRTNIIPIVPNYQQYKQPYYYEVDKIMC